MSPWSIDAMPDQANRTVLVTGATSGLGLAAARGLAKRGARVLVGSRNLERGERVARELGAHAAVAHIDLASLASIRAFAIRANDDGLALDALINNAGVMATPYSRTEDGFELQIGTNHLGHFALTLLLMPALERANHARVVNVTSLWHRAGNVDPDDLDFERRGYDRWAAYGQSKLANLLFTLELNRRLEATPARTRAFSAHPGYARSELYANAKLDGPMAFLTRIGNQVFTQSTEDGALAELRAATDPNARPGTFFGPRGPFEVWGAPVEVAPAKRALDTTCARALWTRSEERTGARLAI